jgi:hypothetical protein
MVGIQPPRRHCILDVEVGKITTVYLEPGSDFDGMIDWAVDNCESFVGYKMLELDYEEKVERDCWFKLEIEFTESRDQLLFELKWL